MPKTKSPEAIETGKKIRERRRELGLSQSQLGKLLRTNKDKPQTASKVSQWERGENMPQPITRPEIADVLQTTVGALFGEPENPELLIRLDLVEKRVDAIIRLQGLGDAVESVVRQGRRADRQKAQKTAAGLRSLRKERAPQGKRRATRKKVAGG